MPRLELALLGSFQASLDGEPIRHFPSDKARALGRAVLEAVLILGRERGLLRIAAGHNS